mgnify:FL=1
MPNINEQAYLKKTINILDKKIEQNKDKLKTYEDEFASRKQELSSEYSDISRGGDLSGAYASLADFENIEENLYKENKRLTNQKNSPYFARINFEPQNKKRTQRIYIGIGNVIQDNHVYVADWSSYRD